MDRQRRIGRHTVGAGILAVLLAMGVFSSWKMDRVHSAVSRQLEDAAWLALAGDWENARLAVAAAESGWQTHRDLTCLLADHTPMEQIDASFSRIGIFSAARNSMEFAAACSELSCFTRAVAEAHRLSWQNLL